MDIEIGAQELRQYASNMKTAIRFMKESLEKASAVMQKTGESFESSAADAFRGQYNSLKSKFDEFYNDATKYAIFLEKTAAAYETSDAETKKAAQDILKA